MTGAGWYGFGFREGAMFGWACFSALVCAVPMIGFDMIAQDIVEGR